MSNFRWRPQRRRYGELNAYVVDGGESPRALAVFCHGYGAPGSDLVALATYFLDRLGAHSDQWRFIFPEAPDSLAEFGMPQGRAWWPINMQLLVQLAAQGNWDLVRREHPPGIDRARALLVSLVDQARGEMPESAPLVLGGFSQGAMLTLDTALRGLTDVPSALVLLSGTLVCEQVWRERSDRLRGIPIVQSHGRWDPILPYSAAENLAEILRDAGSELTFIPFDGPHTIPEEAIDAVSDLLLAVSQP